MVIDLRRCFGCHACSIACKAEQDVPLGFFKSWVMVSEKGRYPNVKRNLVPVLCNHCDRPPCVEACPTRATRQREDGIVTQDEDGREVRFLPAPDRTGIAAGVREHLQRAG